MHVSVSFPWPACRLFRTHRSLVKLSSRRNVITDLGLLRVHAPPLHHGAYTFAGLSRLSMVAVVDQPHEHHGHRQTLGRRKQLAPAGLVEAELAVVVLEQRATVVADGEAKVIVISEQSRVQQQLLPQCLFP